MNLPTPDTNRESAALHIANQLAKLAAIAREHGFKTLGDMLDMAQLEARNSMVPDRADLTLVEFRNAIAKIEQTFAEEERTHAKSTTGFSHGSRPSPLGILKGKLTIVEDIMSPLDVEWDAMK